jgi:hypothetical protein
MSFLNAKVKLAQVLPLAVDGIEAVRNECHLLQTIAYNTSSICQFIDLHRDRINEQFKNESEEERAKKLEQIEEEKWNLSEVLPKIITFCRDYLSGRMKVGPHFLKSLLLSSGKEEVQNNNNEKTANTKNKKKSSKNNNKNVNRKEKIDFYLKNENWHMTTCNIVSLATSLVPLVSNDSGLSTKRKLIDAILNQLPLKGRDESEATLVYHRLIDWISDEREEDEKRKDGGLLAEEEDNIEKIVDAITNGVPARKRSEKMKQFLQKQQERKK